VPLPTATVRLGMLLLILLMISKFVYSVSISSYYTFYLIEHYRLTVGQSQLCLFIFLLAVAVGTIIGGPIGDRIGRRRVILWSILGILPLTLLVPWLPLVPSVIAMALAGMILASAFPAMVVYAQDLMPQHTGMVAGLLFGLAFGIAAVGAAGLGRAGRPLGHRRGLPDLRLPAASGPCRLPAARTARLSRQMQGICPKCRVLRV
jgi:FSR family fosmidomycin resistance protein-like MFS transporter